MSMYDTVHLWLNCPGGAPDLETGLSCLEHQREVISRTTGNVVQKGSLSNLNVTAMGQGVKGQGSLARFYYGSNAESLTRKDSQRAIEKLSDALGLPMNTAKVCRVDVAQNFIMKQPVAEYLCRLGSAKGLRRSDIADRQTAYFGNKQRCLAFYDKSAELIQKARQPIPEPFQGRNVLRYESRFLHRVSRQFEQQSVKAADLHNDIFYMKALDKYRAGYFLIQKIRRDAALDMRNSKSLLKSLAFFGLENIGGYDVALSLIKSAREKGEIDKNNFYRMLKLTKEIASLHPNKEQSPDAALIDELDRKVELSVANYR